MLSPLLQQLERKVEDAIETIQILMLENDELKNKLLSAEQHNSQLRGKETQWEQSISQLLSKFSVSQTTETTESRAHSLELEESLI